MKAVIMCAGKSSRTYPLTASKPKPILKILDKTLIEITLGELKGIVSEAIIVVGYMKEKVIDKIGSEKYGIKIKYVEQTKQLGTGHAILACENELREEDSFIILNGDDIYSKEDLNKLTKDSALGKEVEDPSRYGIFKINEKSFMTDLIEKPEKFIGNLANAGAYCISSNIFEFLRKTKKTKRGEIELTSAIKDYVEKKGIDFKILEIQKLWLPIAYPWSYLEANVIMLQKIAENTNNNTIKNRKNIEIESNVTIKGKVIIEEGTKIFGGSYIEGPAYIGKDCEIGPFCHIRPNTIIMDKCKIGKTELFDCVIMDNSVSKHTSYIAHSVIGERVNIGAGLITADYRHDGKEHLTIINSIKINTGRRKLGAFIGDDVKTGIGTLIYPGRKLWPKTTTLPGEIITKDKIE